MFSVTATVNSKAVPPLKLTLSLLDPLGACSRPAAPGCTRPPPSDLQIVLEFHCSVVHHPHPFQQHVNLLLLLCNRVLELKVIVVVIVFALALTFALVLVVVVVVVIRFAFALVTFLALALVRIVVVVITILTPRTSASMPRSARADGSVK